MRAVLAALLACALQAGAQETRKDTECGELIASARQARTPEHFYRIGMCYLDRGERDAARAWLERAAEAGHAEAKAALARLK